MPTTVRRAVTVVVLWALVIAGCGGDEDEGPPPSIGDATVLERSDDTAP